MEDTVRKSMLLTSPSPVARIILECFFFFLVAITFTFERFQKTTPPTTTRLFSVQFSMLPYSKIFFLEVFIKPQIRE
jgi:hypothetical protein